MSRPTLGIVYGGYDLWEVPVLPIVDLNDDGIVDVVDLMMLIDSWGTDDTLRDIGPMPWGDGIVDVHDLIVLGEHMAEAKATTEEGDSVE